MSRTETRKRPRRRTVIIALLTALLMVPSALAIAKTVTVKATAKDKWAPTHLYIGKGDTVVWRNPTGRAHDLKATSKNWTFRRVLDPGETARRKFGAKGFYKYRCVRHSGIVGGVCRGMCGFVHVF